MASSSSAISFLPDASWAERLAPEAIPAAIAALARLQGILSGRLNETASSKDTTALVDALRLAESLGVPESHVRTLQRNGKIPFTRIGSKYIRFDIAAVRAALSGGAK